MNTEQIAKISWGTCVAKVSLGQLTRPLGLCLITVTTYVSLRLPDSLSQENYALSLGALQTSLYLWYPLATLDNANMHTILVLHMVIKQMIVVLNLVWRASGILIKEEKDN